MQHQITFAKIYVLSETFEALKTKFLFTIQILILRATVNWYLTYNRSHLEKVGFEFICETLFGNTHCIKMNY